MPYATQDDMIKRFGEAEVIQITDRENLGVFNAAVFAQAQLDGDAEIDVYLQSGYPLPLTTVPTVLVRIACDLYRYYLYGNLVPDHVKDRYNAAIKTLQLINKGDVQLNPPTGGGDIPQDSAKDILVAKAEPVFTKETLKGF